MLFLLSVKLIILCLLATGSHLQYRQATGKQLVTVVNKSLLYTIISLAYLALNTAQIMHSLHFAGYSKCATLQKPVHSLSTAAFTLIPDSPLIILLCGTFLKVTLE